MQVEQRFDAELAAQRNLTGLYEKASKDAEERVQTLLKEVQSLKETCENQVRRYNDRLSERDCNAILLVCPLHLAFTVVYLIS